MPRTESHPRLYLAIIALWFVAAGALAASGFLATLVPPVPQAIIGALTVALILAGTLLPGFRVWVAGINLRQLIFFHVTRFVGIAFLVLYGRGELPAAFALPAGWGDIAVATAALGLVLLVPDLIAHRALLVAWNVLGFADILYAVGSGSRAALADPMSMAPLLHFPLALVPFFLVPLVIGSHLQLFFRLKG
ncbi:MAG TPA: hypothetical protein VMT93_06290 [Gemmatimonadaceae bacterium]|nr:hypothetical protein [Gemmatimonadaceae bacterium]